MPQVSVIMPSYNHSRFIGEAIVSVLNQTISDIELVIVDDGSKDETDDVIRQFSDSRIKYIPLSQNVGACEAMNIAIRNCVSEYIAVCNSDDIWEPTKLELQVPILDELPNVAAVFSDVLWINDDSKIIDDCERPHFHNFAQPNRSRHAWIKRLIEDGNCLCHPSVLIRKQAYRDVGTYNNYLRQLPDFDMWLRLVQVYDIHIMSDKLIRFRIHGNNTSQQNPANYRRTWREHNLIARRFFTDVSSLNFIHSFGSLDLRSLASCDVTQLGWEKADYLLNYEGIFRELFREYGIELIFDLSRNGGDERFSASEFHKVTASGGSVVPVEQPVKDKVRPLRAILGSNLYSIVRRWNKRRRQRRKIGR